MKTYRVAIIGCGRIASLLEQETWRGNPNTHAGCFDYCERTQIVAAADHHDERREAFGRRWGVARLYPDWEEMLAQEDLDIVSIATYPAPHRDMTVRAAETGAKAIFCEKAMATTLREADEMIEACRRHSVQLTINHGRRWDWQYRQAQQLLRDGAIGELEGMSLQFAAGLANNGTHYFDMLRYFAGDVEWAVGHLRNPVSLDPQGSGYFAFRSGVRCTVNGATGGHAAHLFELLGTEGRIVVTNERPPRFRLFRALSRERYEEVAVPTVPPEQEVNTFGHGRCVLPVSVYEIAESVDQGEPSCSTGEDGRAALEMVMALHESEAHGNARVEFPLENRDHRILVQREEFVSAATPE